MLEKDDVSPFLFNWSITFLKYRPTALLKVRGSNKCAFVWKHEGNVYALQCWAHPTGKKYFLECSLRSAKEPLQVAFKDMLTAPEYFRWSHLFVPDKLWWGEGYEDNDG